FDIITEGEVELVIKTPEGWERTVDRLGPSRFFGELGILTGKNPATARATKHTELIALDAHSFTELMKRDAVVRSDVEADMKRLHELKYATAAPPIPAGGWSGRYHVDLRATHGRDRRRWLCRAELREGTGGRPGA